MRVEIKEATLKDNTFTPSFSSQEEDIYLTPNEVAKRLKLNPYTVYRYIHLGELRAYLFGNTYRIKYTDLLEFLEKAKTKKHKRRKENIIPEVNRQ